MRSLLFPFWPTLIVALVVALTLSGCAPKMVKTVEFGNPQTTLRILIATEQSEFKQAVTEKVINEFEDTALFFKITDLRNYRCNCVNVTLFQTIFILKLG